MQATDILKNEHEVILRVLSCLEQLAARTEERGSLDIEPSEEILDFIANFADRCHHGKEEGQLFPLLVEKGLPREVGPVAVMYSEHDEGRELVASMRRALAEGDAGATDFASRARAFVQLLRDHISKENHVLFPMADGMMQPAEDSELVAAFERIEHDDMGPGCHERYLLLAQRLCERFGVDWDAPVAVPTGHGCGHGGASSC